jgi:hypothetical protein
MKKKARFRFDAGLPTCPCVDARPKGLRHELLRRLGVGDRHSEERSSRRMRTLVTHLAYLRPVR